MDDQSIFNARITETRLGTDDHSFLTAYISFDFGGSGQSYGGYALDDRPAEGESSRQPSRLAGRCIVGILDALEVTLWERLVGTYVRVRKPKGYFGQIDAIGHILKDRWFSFDEAVEADRQRDQQITMSIIDTVAPAVKVEEVLPEKARSILERINQAPRNKRYFTESDRVIARDVLATFPTAAMIASSKDFS